MQPFKLSSKDKKMLLELEPDLNTVAEEIAKAERAGLDMKSIKADFDKSRKLREGILREYS